MSVLRTQKSLSMQKKIWSLAIGFLGFGMLLFSVFDVFPDNLFWLFVCLAMMSCGILSYAYQLYRDIPEGIKNNHNYFNSLSSRGWLGWLTGFVLTGFYILLYWYPEYLGQGEKSNSGLVAFFDPLSQLLKKQNASQWFVYGTLYTLAILVFGIKFIWKYRHSKYQVIRTLSVIFFQLAFAFLIPEFMLRLNMPYHDFKNMWPLNYYFFDGWHLQEMMHNGNVGWLMLIWGVLMIVVVSPVLTYFFGKRWYCSWVCGCGGLAETAGDSFRHLSDKSIAAWKIEKYLIYSVLVFSVLMTAGVLYSFYTGQAKLAGMDTASLRSWYGFLIGSAFSGVIGVGFYPLLGSRVWCRFGCPMAAILGIQQKFFSRFRITTNGGQCISCGNCSTYCEMGIDVRAYAQKGQDIVRASCVGCGVCSAVCPRGVLRLENGSIDIFERGKKDILPRK
jgi:ferredoxin-type protein NapH